jgi:hypothetical protein
MRGGGGILLIGGGIFLLILGWTGKFQDVWNALTGGGSSGDGAKPGGSEKTDSPAIEKGPPAKNCPQGRPRTFPEGAVGIQTKQSQCCPGETLMYMPGETPQTQPDGIYLCTSPEHVDMAQSNGWVKYPVGAGYGAVWDELPTGFIGLRKNPSARLHT